MDSGIYGHIGVIVVKHAMVHADDIVYVHHLHLNVMEKFVRKNQELNSKQLLLVTIKMFWKKFNEKNVANYVMISKGFRRQYES